jgi:predicted TIM-barrel fold metal-dependent hydrolase
LYFGSDFPFTPWRGCKFLVQQLEDSKHLDATTRDAIFLDNAYDLFRR